MTSDGYIYCTDRLPDRNGIYQVIGTVRTEYQGGTFIQELEFRDGEWIIPPHLKGSTVSIGMWRPAQWI
ncbi:MAG: hypothetical protein GX933_01900 [Chloroflexi bacterium]|nr:hypothetical protein [Chloroflexota bacterium]